MAAQQAGTTAGGTKATMGKGSSAATPGPPNGGGGKGLSQQEARADAEDDEGFQPVKGRGWRRARHAEAKGGATASGIPRETGDEAQGEAPERHDEHEEEDGADPEPPSPNSLHRAWQEEVGVVRRLKQQGLPSDHPAMRAACAARDDAEKSWRDAKDPAPAAVRLARAQSKLDRAIEIQAETRRVLTEYEQAHAERLAALHARLEEDGSRVRARRQQLESIQEEVGAEGLGARTRAQQGEAARKVHSTLGSTVAPTIAALVEELDSSTPAWSVLNGLLGTLSDSQRVLESAFAKPTEAQRYDIADHGDAAPREGDDGWEEGDVSEWSESHELQEDLDAPQYRHTAGGGHGESHDYAEGKSSGGAGDHSMGTGEWWDASPAQWTSGARWQECGHGKWSRSSWADQWEHEQAEDDDSGDQPAAARRRLDNAPASEGGAGGAAQAEGQAEDDRRRKLHDERVQRIVLAAIEAKVQPITSRGEDLHVLDAGQLDAWVAENIPGHAEGR